MIPKLFRKWQKKPVDENEKRRIENTLLQHFRLKAPALGVTRIPARNETDQWLFLAGHVGLPTRLLDWSEGLLAALYFALHDAAGQPRKKEDGAIVWMLEPLELNRLAIEGKVAKDQFPLTWFSEDSQKPGRLELVNWFSLISSDDATKKKEVFEEILTSIKGNVGSLNIRHAWGEPVGTDLPAAVLPTSIHPRILAQKSCFTVQGRKENPWPDLPPDVLKKYEIADEGFDPIRRDLRIAGITHSVLFPDLDGLATELKWLLLP